MLMLVCVGWAGGANSLVAAENDSSSSPALEYKIKAGYLFNFATFVEWPVRTNNVTTNFVMVIADDGKIFPLMSAFLAGKSVQGKSVEARSLKAGEDLKQCDLLFVARSQEKRVDELLKRVGKAPVLTVGEMDGFATRGGCINFTAKGDVIRFEVNLETAAHAGLKISSKIAAMATVVHSPGGAK